MEILQTQEEAKDHVYYDALKRISASKVSRLTFSYSLFVPVEIASVSVFLTFNVRFGSAARFERFYLL